MGVTDHASEIAQGRRFEFGANWTHFLGWLSDERIVEAEKSLISMLGQADLTSKLFLDVGSGSGLFSLAARRLRAQVRSFDYDPQSVACTQEIKHRYFPDDPAWIVERGSVLDTDYLAVLGKYDVVYSWGVLHHTGAMWRALANVIPLIAPHGCLYISIYNDQGWLSRYWGCIKLVYNRIPLLRWPLLLVHAPYFCGLRWLVRAAGGRRVLERGMSLWHDMVDWLGGYPFEVARPDEIENFCRNRGLLPAQIKTCGGRSGCNEFVFVWSQPRAS